MNASSFAPLRTLQVVNVRWFNATAWYGLKLAHLLRRAGHESHVAALAETDTFRKAEALGLDPVPLPLNATNPLTLPALWAKMRRLLRDVRPHVVNCHRGESFVFWGLLKERGQYALVRTRGDQRLPKKNLPNRLLHAHAADAVIAPNSVMARHFIHGMGVPAPRVHTIFGGVDTALFRFDPAGRAAVRARYGFADDHFVVGLLGRFDHVKAQRETLLALGRLIRAGFSRVRLLLIGFPTAVSGEQVESWIREAGVAGHVAITGKVEDVPACLSALDMGVVPSLWSETIARAALEMMACGLPLVATSVGVMPDLLPREALIAPEGWRSPAVLAAALPEALAAMVRRGMESPEWLNELARRNVERIATLRDEDFLEQSLAVYAEALQRRGLRMR